MKRKQIRPPEYDEANQPEVLPDVLEYIEPEPIVANTTNEIPVYYTGGGNAKIEGNVTGKTYIFKEGFPTPVDEADVPELFGKKKIGQCCGSGEAYETNLFEKG